MTCALGTHLVARDDLSVRLLHLLEARQKVPAQRGVGGMSAQNNPRDF